MAHLEATGGWESAFLLYSIIGLSGFSYRERVFKGFLKKLILKGKTYLRHFSIFFKFGVSCLLNFWTLASSPKITTCLGACVNHLGMHPASEPRNLLSNIWWVIWWHPNTLNWPTRSWIGTAQFLLCLKHFFQVVKDTQVSRSSPNCWWSYCTKTQEWSKHLRSPLTIL